MARKGENSDQQRPVRRPADSHAFDHISPEERFLLLIAPQMGAARAAKCFRLDESATAVEWKKFTGEELDLNLKS